MFILSLESLVASGAATGSTASGGFMHLRRAGEPQRATADDLRHLTSDICHLSFVL